MKILLMCPFIDTQHAISRRLRASGNALLFPSNVDEAIKMIQLHGASLDLAIIHREGLSDGFQAAAAGDAPEEGIRLVGQIKGRKETKELPLIITSTRWSDVDFVRHQDSPHGANAYLRWPFSENDLVQVIEDMFGSPIRFARGSQTQPSITLPTGIQEDRTTTKILQIPGASVSGARPGLPTEGFATTRDPDTKGTTGPTIMLEDVSALIEADRSATMAPPVPGMDGTPSLQGDDGTSVSLINVPVKPPGSGNTDAVAQFGTAMLEGANPSGNEIELDPPSIGEGGTSLMKQLRPSSEPETLDLSDVDSLEPYERLLLKNPPAHGADGSVTLRDGQEDDTTNLLDVGGTKGTATGATKGLPTRAAPSGTSLEPEQGTSALGTASFEASPAGTEAANSEVEESLEMSGILERAVSMTPEGAPDPAPGSDLNSVISSRRDQRQFSAPPDPAEERQLAEDLPYLFGKGKDGAASQGQGEAVDPRLFFSEPIGDAVIPGGVSKSPDTETLKRYLLLREQDVAVLSNQLSAAKDQVLALEKQVREERAKGAELGHRNDDQKRKLDEAGRDKNLALAALQTELDELRFQAKAKSDRARMLEAKVRDSGEEIERMKERVRSDVQKIRVRERDLENRLEIMKKDSEALIGARESKIIELKRKVDMLEFSMDLLQDKYTREKEATALLKERLARAAQVVRVAGGLLDSKGFRGQAGSGDGTSAANDGRGEPGGKQEAS